VSTITIQVPEELSDLLAEAGDRLPELLAQGLRQHTLLVYRYVLAFIASKPWAEEVDAFAPTPEMTERLKTLLAREAANSVTPSEKVELDEYERLEHQMVMIKAGRLRNAHAS